MTEIDERAWTLHKRSGEWDDVIEGPDAEEVRVRPATVVAALREELAAIEAMYDEVHAALEQAGVPFTGAPDARGWLPHLGAPERVATLAASRDELREFIAADAHHEMQTIAGLLRLYCLDSASAVDLEALARRLSACCARARALIGSEQPQEARPADG